ncbi:MAG: DNA primase, partial [Gammaproteobacteria bacterium]
MAEMIPRDFIELLLAKVDIVDVINAQVPLRKKSSSNYFARCPFHQEKSPSFSVSQPKQFYYCFGCGARGNAIDFLMQHERLRFPEAIETLARSAGMEVPRTAAAGKQDDSLPALYDLMAAVTSYYYDQMRHSSRAIAYLKQRGITGAIARDFSLGYAPSGSHHLLEQFSDQKKLLEAGLIIKKSEGNYYDRFRDRIMFPIHDHRSRIIGFGGRILDQGEPKYLNSPETALFQKGHELYGLYQALQANRKLERVVIVEGYMDVLALFQQGITYAVATLGTATTPHHLQRLFRYTSDIIFCFDGDAAGRTAAWRALQVIFPMMQDSLQVRFLFLPEGEDPDTLIRQEGKAPFEKRLSAALPLSTFFFQTLSRQSDLTTMEGRARFAAAAVNYIKQLPSDSIFQGILFEELSKRARIEVEALKSPPPAPPPLVEKGKPSGLSKALALLIQYPHLVTHLPDRLSMVHLPGYDLFTQLVEIMKKNPNMTTGVLIEYWRNHPQAAFIHQL